MTLSGEMQLSDLQLQRTCSVPLRSPLSFEPLGVGRQVGPARRSGGRA